MKEFEIKKAEIDCKVRLIELNLLQRCASHLLSKTDIDEAYQLGHNVVLSATTKQSGVMISFTTR